KRMTEKQPRAKLWAIAAVLGVVLLAVLFGTRKREKAKEARAEQETVAPSDTENGGKEKQAGTGAAPKGETPTGATTSAKAAVATRMHNVMFHFTDKAAAHIEDLNGTLQPVGKYEMPVFDDKGSFQVVVGT